jgi:hypothetical protein
MKNLFLFFLLIPVGLFAQNMQTKKFVTDMTRTADTSIVFKVSDNYQWQIFVTWASNDGTTSTIHIEQSINGTNYVDYGGLPVTTVTGTTGSVGYEDSFVTGTYLRVVFTIQSGKTVKFNAWYNLKKNL